MKFIFTSHYMMDLDSTEEAEEFRKNMERAGREEILRVMKSTLDDDVDEEDHSEFVLELNTRLMFLGVGMGQVPEEALIP